MTLVTELTSLIKRLQPYNSAYCAAPTVDPEAGAPSTNPQDRWVALEYQPGLNVQQPTSLPAPVNMSAHPTSGRTPTDLGADIPLPATMAKTALQCARYALWNGAYFAALGLFGGPGADSTRLSAIGGQVGAGLGIGFGVLVGLTSVTPERLAQGREVAAHHAFLPANQRCPEAIITSLWVGVPAFLGCFTTATVRMGTGPGHNNLPTAVAVAVGAAWLLPQVSPGGDSVEPGWGVCFSTDVEDLLGCTVSRSSSALSNPTHGENSVRPPPAPAKTVRFSTDPPRSSRPPLRRTD